MGMAALVARFPEPLVAGGGDVHGRMVLRARVEGVVAQVVGVRL